MVTLLPLYPGKYNPSVGDKGGSRRGTHTAPRPYVARAPFGFGSLGACPGHSSTVIGRVVRAEQPAYLRADFP